MAKSGLQAAKWKILERLRSVKKDFFKIKEKKRKALQFICSKA